jgi:hypothetical protein
MFYPIACVHLSICSQNIPKCDLTGGDIEEGRVYISLAVEEE